MDFNNLKILSNQAMVGSTQAWVEPSDARDALNGIKEVSGFLDQMESAQRPAPLPGHKGAAP